MKAASPSGASNLARQGRGGTFRLTVNATLSPLFFSGGIHKPFGSRCTGSYVANLAAVGIPSTTADTAHARPDPQVESGGVTYSSQMAGTSLVPNITPITPTKTGALLPPCEAGPPVTTGGSNMAPAPN
ncbi:hypothetical protein NHX12_032321 [Muraenolepis orangiensis]|uniref:Uncharacterized protein n=1 Tax=Muraenolepis orangiensis TaxID=630683 RepID=A0A9Q0E642_9TELE|nr:hypothetical protein NHX12_032321 [Muraenolepis orangiensis]